MTKLVIIDYGCGNLHSVQKAVARAAHHAGVILDICVSADAQQVYTADQIILPGVGAFGACMAKLQALPGMIDALEQRVLQNKVPFLGICVGMQLLASVGLEFGKTRGLGWIPGEVHPIALESTALKVPHMGWNAVLPSGTHKVICSDTDNHAYFVHSYHFIPTHTKHVLATTVHGMPMVAAIGHHNIIGTQFHPEKSQAFGLGVIKRFLTWQPDKEYGPYV